MEDDLQPKVIGIGEDILIELHRVLFVAGKEVHLDTLDTNLLQPSHLLASHAGVVHALFGCLGCVVLISVAVVPQQQAHALALCIAAQFLYPFVADVLVPASVYETVFVAHGCCEVDESHLVVVVDGVVLPDEPAPGVTSWAVVVFGLVERFHHVVGHRCLGDGLEGLAHGDGAPGGMSRQCESGIGCAHTVGFTLHGEGDAVAAFGIEVGEMASHIVAVHARLTDEHPESGVGFLLVFLVGIGNAEETGEGISLAIFRLHVHGIVGHIFLFVTGFGAHPSDHRVRLRTDERTGFFRQTERGGFSIDNETFQFPLLCELIPEGHIVVGHSEDDAHGPFLGIAEVEPQLVGLVMYLRGLRAPHAVGLVDGSCMLLLQGECLAEVAFVGRESQL